MVGAKTIIRQVPGEIWKHVFSIVQQKLLLIQFQPCQFLGYIPHLPVRPRLIEWLNEGVRVSACHKPEGMPKESRLDYGNEAPLAQ